MNLNDKQIEAVNCTEGPLLILAGAGSGKTTVLINRIYHLINDLGVSPYNILAITFTNKAADELKSRLESRLGDEGLDIWACTFHSACVRILRRFSDRVGYDCRFSIYDTSDSLSLIKHILKDMNLDEKFYDTRSILAEISHAKDSMILPDDFSRYARITADLHKIKLGEIYSEYVKRLKNSNSMDFDDLLLNTVILLKDNPEVRQYWLSRFKYLLIDEYQDTNKLQYMFATLLTGPEENICVVGDDDQSIYKFRGATIENILNFEKQFKSCTVIRLEQNYRSTGHILGAANDVIRNNTERKGKELWTDKDNGERVVHYFAENQDDEAGYVASVILKGIYEGDNYRDFAVLYRVNAQSNTLEYAFKRNGIPYRIVGGTRFFDRAEIKDILSYLQVISTHDDNLRLERIINNPPRGIGNKSLELVQNIASAENVSLFSVISNADKYEPLQKSAPKFLAFASMIEELSEFSQNNPLELLYDKLLDLSGYIRHLESKNTVEDSARIENVKELKSSILTYYNESGDATLEGYLADVALYTDLDNYDTQADSVTLMTMHSSKGLEFPTVFVAGMEETVFPSIRSIGSQPEMEEERRLCYVAMTRAMKKLYLISANQRMLYGHTSVNRNSRFIDEISDEHIISSAPKNFRYSGRSDDYYEQTDSFRTANNPRSKLAVQIKPQITEIPDLISGDAVSHKAFGSGHIIKMTPMGGDYLMEIQFDKVGVKKLMLKAAYKFLTKL